jgi:hypothetical protein
MLNWIKTLKRIECNGHYSFFSVKAFFSVKTGQSTNAMTNSNIRTPPEAGLVEPRVCTYELANSKDRLCV